MFIPSAPAAPAAPVSPFAPATPVSPFAPAAPVSPVSPLSPFSPAVAATQETIPDPFVANTWPLVPSVLGIVIAPAVIVPLVFTLVTSEFPNCMELLTATLAPEPIAVALVKSPSETSA